MREKSARAELPGQGRSAANASTLMLTNWTLTGNSAFGSAGGGIFNDDGTMTVTGCTFSRNSANFGGGIEESGDTMTVTNCTFAGNSSSGGGDGGRSTA